MPTSEKVDKVEELTAAMSNAKAIYLADFTGLDVAKVTGLRNKLREAEVGYQVVKNRLAKRAAAEAGISGLDEHLIGPTAIAFTNEDPIAPAKICPSCRRAKSSWVKFWEAFRARCMVWRAF
jgi:large subunit ribosomal protein L10